MMPGYHCQHVSLVTHDARLSLKTRLAGHPRCQVITVNTSRWSPTIPGYHCQHVSLVTHDTRLSLSTHSLVTHDARLSVSTRLAGHPRCQVITVNTSRWSPTMPGYHCQHVSLVTTMPGYQCQHVSLVTHDTRLSLSTRLAGHPRYQVISVNTSRWLPTMPALSVSTRLAGHPRCQVISVNTSRWSPTIPGYHCQHLDTYGVHTATSLQQGVPRVLLTLQLSSCVHGYGHTSLTTPYRDTMYRTSLEDKSLQRRKTALTISIFTGQTTIFLSSG